MPSNESNAKNTGEPIRVLQLSDTHLFGSEDGRLLGVDTFASLQAVIELAQSCYKTADCILLTGDLVQEDPDKAYHRLAEVCQDLKRLYGRKIYCIPGNHDDPAIMRKVLSQYSDLFAFGPSVVFDSWQIVLLSSAKEGYVSGRLGDPQLASLDMFLTERPDHFSLLTMHHQPMPVGSYWIDRISLEDNDKFARVIARHKNVRVIAWGHVHQEFSHEQDGIIWLSCPSTCVQFKPAREFALDDKLPGFRLIELFSDGTIQTKVHRLENYNLGLDLNAKGY